MEPAHVSASSQRLGSGGAEDHTWCRYLFNWYFQQDGTIEYEIKLTGELSTNQLSQGESDPEFGTLVAPGVNAQHHQHMFCARLDMAVDDPNGGAGLVVSEVCLIPLSLGRLPLLHYAARQARAWAAESGGLSRLEMFERRSLEANRSRHDFDKQSADLSSNIE